MSRTMIFKFECDGCGKHHESETANLPEGWHLLKHRDNEIHVCSPVCAGTYLAKVTPTTDNDDIPF